MVSFEAPPIDNRGRVPESASLLARITAITRICKDLRHRRAALPPRMPPQAELLARAARAPGLIRLAIEHASRCAFSRSKQRRLFAVTSSGARVAEIIG